MIMFGGWTLSISALVPGMNEFEMKQLNSLTLLTATYKEYLIYSLIICKNWWLF